MELNADSNHYVEGLQLRLEVFLSRLLKTSLQGFTPPFLSEKEVQLYITPRASLSMNTSPGM